MEPPDVLGDDEQHGQDGPPRALRRAVLAVLAVVLVAAYGPGLARSSGVSRLLSAGTPSPSASSAPPAIPSSAPTPGPTRAPSSTLSQPEEPSPASMLAWPIRGDLAADHTFGEIVTDVLSRSGLRKPQLLWLGSVTGGRLALAGELTGTGGVEVTAVHVPRGMPARGVRPEPAGAVYDGDSSLVGWVGPMVDRERALVVLGPPRSILLGVSHRVDDRRDGPPHRRWQSYTAARGELVTALAEPVFEPVLVRRPASGPSSLLRLGFDPGRVPRSADIPGLDPVAYPVADTGRYLP